MMLGRKAEAAEYEGPVLSVMFLWFGVVDVDLKISDIGWKEYIVANA